MQHRPISPVPRRLLARVRDVMAGAGAAAERLERIAAVIAADLVAEVCSVYVRRAGDVMELFATQGLNPDAVHNTRLRMDEGLIGGIAANARPLALADAQHHPNFAYRPETGEEIYQSLMGVPILRGGRVIGVLAVQNKTRRSYAEEEVETLETVAMVLAELVAGGELIETDEFLPADGTAVLPLRLEGVTLNGGLGAGVAVLHQPQFRVGELVAEDPARELERLRLAVTEMRGALDTMLGSTELSGRGEHRAVLETYRMIADDVGWLTRIEEAVGTGLTAEASVQMVHSDIRARLGKAPDRYLRERLYDFEDLANRLLRHLAKGEPARREVDTPADVIVVARSMGPAQLLDYHGPSLRGLVLEEGSPTMHVAIVARALDIPVVGQAKEAFTRIEQGDPVLVDGDNAVVFIRPGEDAQQNFAEAMRAIAQRRAGFATLRDLPAETRDGERISININAGLLADMRFLGETGADGVGLFRTEIPFMVRAEFPSIEAQRALYTDILDQAQGKPVLFRTLDVGGDKTLPYWKHAQSENPAMGWRAIRVSLDRPAMLRQQIRALIGAAAGRELSVMFPMIAEVSEFDAAREILDREVQRARGRGAETPTAVEVGAMLEVPSLVFQLDALLSRVDFVSVGTNDLFQFLFASDRGDPRLAERYDFLSPVTFAVLRTVLEGCREAGVPVGVCGEAASRPLDAMAMIGLGFRNFSVPPPAVGPAKSMIRSLTLGPLTSYLGTLATLTHHSVREQLREFALDHGVLI